jgi:Peptidase M15
VTFRVGLFFLLTVLLLGLVYRLLIASEGMQVTSWWRSFWHNIEVGGVKASLHQIGLAWDVLPVTQENIETLNAMGLTVINEGDHLHAQIWGL